MRSIILLAIVIGATALTACAGGGVSAGPQTVMVTSDQPLDLISPEVNRESSASSSLWKEISARNLFQDLRAYKVGDLITVHIVETSNASKTSNTQTSRSSSIDAGIDNVLGWEGRAQNLTSFGKGDVHDAYNNASMFKGSLENSFNGAGSTSRDESMTASITAQVFEVKPSGNLFIKGTRQVKVNNETQYIILSGLIRPVDISPGNTVLSSYIGDAKIEYTGRGAVSDKQRPGWLTRAVDFIWPF